MKKLFILFFSILLSLNTMAQLEVKEGSFKEVVGFVNINTDMMYDDNDKPYAVLKVKTESINDKERRELLFQGDARTFIECEYKVGEVWLYISYYATYLKISHPDYGSTEFWFPFDMQGKKGYELTLFNKPSIDEDFQKRLERLETELSKQQNQIISEDVTLHYNEKTQSETEINKTPSTKSLRKKGWVLRPEIGAGILLLDDYSYNQYSNLSCFVFKINTVYQFNPFFSLGVGVGVNMESLSMISMPLYVNQRVYLNNKKTSMFLGLKFGYSVNVKSYILYSQDYYGSNYYIHNYDERKCNGLFGAFEIGLEYKHSSYGLSLGLQQYYDHYESSYYDQDININLNSNYSIDSNQGYILFKYGYSIFFNKK